MKKIVSLLAAFLIAISGSVCVFAAQSPGGVIKPDQFNIVGTVTQKGEKAADIIVEIGNKKDTTSDKGAYRIEGIEAGSHTVSFKKANDELGTVSFKIAKGKTTKYVKLADGSYDITVASNVATINIDFDIKEDGTAEITKVTPAGNGSPIGPPMGDMFTNIAMLVFALSLTGILVSVFFKKKYSC